MNIEKYVIRELKIRVFFFFFFWLEEEDIALAQFLKDQETFCVN